MQGPIIICIGVTPALQRTLRFNSLELEQVNRCSKAYESASGKATNVARVLKLLLGDLRKVEVALVEFVGGQNGEKYRKLLGFDTIAVETSVETRICQTLLFDGSATELVEEALNPTETEWEELLARTQQKLKDAATRGHGLGVLTGSPPPGSDPTRYKQILELAKNAGVKFIVDCQKRPLVEALAANPWLVKINQEELDKTILDTCRSDTDLNEKARSLIRAGAQNIIITQGKDSVWLVLGSSSTFYQFVPPVINAVNPIGSGDSMAAGIAFHLTMGTEISPCKSVSKGTLIDAVKFGIACGASNAETDSPGIIDKTRVADLLPRIIVQPHNSS